MVVALVASACGESAKQTNDAADAGSAGVAQGGTAGAGAGGDVAAGGNALASGRGGASDAGGAGRGSAGGGGAGADAGRGGAGGAAGRSGAAGAAGAGGRRVMLPTPCTDPEEVVPGGGLVKCDNGIVHRPSAGVCPTYVPSDETHDPSTLPDQDECFTDAECTERPLGFCTPGYVRSPGVVRANRCGYACTVDADCDEGLICVCNETGGTCSGPSNCLTDTDCDEGAFCAPYAPQCDEPTEFACQTPTDECALYSDCPSGLVCGSLDGVTRTCTLPPCAG
jgi:hypothetical protein